MSSYSRDRGGFATLVEETMGRIREWDRQTGGPLARQLADTAATASRALATASLAYDPRATASMAADPTLTASIAADARATASGVMDPLATGSFVQDASGVASGLAEAVKTQRTMERLAQLEPAGQRISESLATGRRLTGDVDLLSQPAWDLGRPELGTAFNHMIDGSVSGIDWDSLHQRLGFADEMGRLTQDLIGAYAHLSAPASFGDELFTLESFPGIELFAHANLLRSLSYSGSAEPEDAERKEEPTVHEDLEGGSRVNLEMLLARYFPELLDLWLGALEAVSNNHDSVRKYCASQRALLERLLLRAAPNHAVVAWTTDSRYLSGREGGKPNWAGRLAYLCFRADRQGLTYFAVRDVRAARQTWKQLNEGVHAVPSAFSSPQLSALRLRSNCLILMAVMLATQTTYPDRP